MVVPFLPAVHSAYQDAGLNARKLASVSFVVRRKMTIELPEEYKQYLATGRIEGGLTVDPGWYQLWPLDRVAEYNKEYGVEEFAPGFLAFGSSGGGEILVFDQQHRIFMIPAVGMSPEEALLVAETWQDFERAIER